MEKNSKLMYQVCSFFLINYFIYDKIKNDLVCLGPFTFTIGDTRNFGVYEGGGTVTEVKKPETVHFVSISFFYYLHKYYVILLLFRNPFRNH